MGVSALSPRGWGLRLMLSRLASPFFFLFCLPTSFVLCSAGFVAQCHSFSLPLRWEEWREKRQKQVEEETNHNLRRQGERGKGGVGDRGEEDGCLRGEATGPNAKKKGRAARARSGGPCGVGFPSALAKPSLASLALPHPTAFGRLGLLAAHSAPQFELEQTRARSCRQRLGGTPSRNR